VFILALDKVQLRHSIGAVYGSGIDSGGYLRRFIDFEYQLKKPDIKNYIDSLFLALQLEEFFAPRKQYRELQYDQEHLKNVFYMLASGLGLSLREIEQLLANINIAIRTAKENEYIYPALLVFLIVSKNFQANAYKRYISEEGGEEELIKYLHSIVPEKKRGDSFECALVEGSLIAAKSNHFRKSESAIFSRHKEIVQDEDLDYKEKQYSEFVVNVVTKPAGFGHHVNLKALSERIDWLSRFEFLDGKG